MLPIADRRLATKAGHHLHASCRRGGEKVHCAQSWSKVNSQFATQAAFSRTVTGRARGKKLLQLPKHNWYCNDANCFLRQLTLLSRPASPDRQFTTTYAYPCKTTRARPVDQAMLLLRSPAAASGVSIGKTQRSGNLCQVPRRASNRPRRAESPGKLSVYVLSMPGSARSSLACLIPPPLAGDGADGRW